MVWIILFFIIILISAVLAFRSMRDYEEFPDTLSLNSLFYIGNPGNFDETVLKKLHDLFLSSNQFFALEKLIRGKEKARVLFGPAQLIRNFPELGLVELEDYIGSENGIKEEDSDKKVNVDQSLSWLVEPKNNPNKTLHVDQEVIDNMVLEPDERVFIQLILMPLEKEAESLFQATFRVMVVHADPIKRIGLSKKVNQILETATGLKRSPDGFPETKKFESFKHRSLVPKEVANFPLTAGEVLALI